MLPVQDTVLLPVCQGSDFSLALALAFAIDYAEIFDMALPFDYMSYGQATKCNFTSAPPNFGYGKTFDDTKAFCNTMHCLSLKPSHVALPTIACWYARMLLNPSTSSATLAPYCQPFVGTDSPDCRAGTYNPPDEKVRKMTSNYKMTNLTKFLIMTSYLGILLFIWGIFWGN